MDDLEPQAHLSSNITHGHPEPYCSADLHTDNDYPIELHRGKCIRIHGIVSARPSNWSTIKTDPVVEYQFYDNNGKLAMHFVIIRYF